ncbi:MAG: succinylglutamate desuccinylase/aspartoacylase family protein [Robiginitalea sp.]|uniref:succinylglutamate desuccinylase/aspartoacylase family protein n=1 Tax=Robiginitalea sp. TaxID=1902411 RepID=UPI003C7623DF
MIKTQREENKTAAGERILCRITADKPGPTVVFFGGIHGNEPAGVAALTEVLEALAREGRALEMGALIGIRGNLPALVQKERFLDHDLNRIWSRPRLESVMAKPESERSSEEKELVLIYALLQELLQTCTPPFYFIDLHTTSSRTRPFITINDSIINRYFSRIFPVPVILGIEEYLEGPLLSYINELGYVALGFESGTHNDPAAIRNAADFIWLTLGFTGLLPDYPGREDSFKRLDQASESDHDFYEVFYRHELPASHTFRMKEGFWSFQSLPKGTVLGSEAGAPVAMQKKGILFMPLYQKQGEEGFFLIRKTPAWALRLSAKLRKWKTHELLTHMPGVRWADSRQDKLLVNLSVARFLNRPIFHLLGYRSRQRDKTHLLISNREHKARNADYSHTFWFSEE